jgi:hypothetical protein
MHPEARRRRCGITARPAARCYRCGVANHIRDVALRPIQDDDGGHALFIALELADPSQLLGLLEEAVTRFKAERLAAPPDAQFLLITFVGDLSAAEFADAWRSAVANDVPARSLLGTMQRADVMQCDASGGVLGQVSLLAAPEEPEPRERPRGS